MTSQLQPVSPPFKPITPPPLLDVVYAVLCIYFANHLLPTKLLTLQRASSVVLFVQSELKKTTVGFFEVNFYIEHFYQNK